MTIKDKMSLRKPGDGYGCRCLDVVLEEKD